MSKLTEVEKELVVHNQIMRLLGFIETSKVGIKRPLWKMVFASAFQTAMELERPDLIDWNIVAELFTHE